MDETEGDSRYLTNYGDEDEVEQDEEEEQEPNRNDEFALHRQNDETNGDIQENETDEEDENPNRNDNFTLHRQNDGFALQRKNDDFTLHRKIDDFALHRQNDDFALQRKNDNFALHRQNDDFALQRKSVDFALHRQNDDFALQRKNDDLALHRHPKKRKLKSLLSSFEPPLPLPPPPPAAKTGGRNTHTDWSEQETFVLLDSWGERFLKRGRKSLRSEEWQEVAEKVSQVSSKIERTDTQCRNRLDTLKKKYKKEKSLLQKVNKSQRYQWVYFKKMDMLMSSNLQQPNGFHEIRDSPVNTDSQDDYSDPIPLRKSKSTERGANVNGGLFKILADSINKFSEIYEKIESEKRKQMVELEKMRMEFYRELDLEKRMILDRAREKIMKIRQGNYEENDSAEG